MKTRRLFTGWLTVLLILALLDSPGALAQGRSTPFRYRHDPRLNAKAMSEIIVDPSAVFGFSPNPDGTLAAYAKYDWHDADAVAGYRESRLEYFESYRQLYDLLDGMTAAGNSTEEIARAVSAKRNELRFAAYQDDPDGLASLKKRNLDRYGHEEGPLADELYEQYGSWDTVIEKAFTHNSGMDACVGLYDDYYKYYIAFGYITDECETPASREYAIAAFADAAGLDGGEDLNGFADVSDVGAPYVRSVAGAVAAGLAKGYEDGTLRPKETITRAEALALLARCLPESAAPHGALTLPGVPAWAEADLARLPADLAEGDALDALTVAQVRLLTERVAGLPGVK